MFIVLMNVAGVMPYVIGVVWYRIGPVREDDVKAEKTFMVRSSQCQRRMTPKVIIPRELDRINFEESRFWRQTCRLW